MKETSDELQDIQNTDRKYWKLCDGNDKSEDDMQYYCEYNNDGNNNDVYSKNSNNEIYQKSKNRETNLKTKTPNENNNNNNNKTKLWVKALKTKNVWKKKPL